MTFATRQALVLTGTVWLSGGLDQLINMCNSNSVTVCTGASHRAAAGYHFNGFCLFLAKVSWAIFTSRYLKLCVSRLLCQSTSSVSHRLYCRQVAFMCFLGVYALCNCAWKICPGPYFAENTYYRAPSFIHRLIYIRPASDFHRSGEGRKQLSSSF